MARKQLHDFNLRTQPGAELIWTFDTTWGDEHFEAGSIVPDHIASKVHKMRDQFHRKRVQLWRDDADDALVGDETLENTPEKGAEDADRPLVGDELPDTVEVTGQLVADLCPVGGETADAVQPKPYKSGPGWWRIEGVDEAFRTKDEAQAAWDLNHALGG